MNKCFLSLLIPVLVLGCRATDDRPIVDMQGVNIAQYNADLAECQVYADEVQAGRQVARGAVGGAVVGGAVGAAVGNSGTAQRTAGAGAVLGASRGAQSAMSERERVIRNCLRGRGYRVLN
jgi:outer membrane lipoprotein SlyB